MHLQAAQVFPDSVTVSFYQYRAALSGVGDADRLVSDRGDCAELVGGGFDGLRHTGYCIDYHAFQEEIAERGAQTAALLSQAGKRCCMEANNYLHT